MELMKILVQKQPQLLAEARDQYRNFGTISLWLEKEVSVFSKNWQAERGIFIEKIAKTAK